MQLGQNTMWTFLAAFSMAGCSSTAPTSTPKTTPNPPQAQQIRPAKAATSSPGNQQSAGVVQNVRQAARRVADTEDLKNLALAYVQFALLNGKGPSSLNDLKDSLTPKMIEGFEDKELYVVKWNVANPTGTSVLAYAKDPDSYGTRLVAKGDGSVTRMTKEEFDQANAGR